MIKGFISIFLLLAIQSGSAQQKTFTAAEKASLDSMFKDDEFINLLKKALKPKSYFLLSAGLGNSYFSIKNKRLEAAQLESKLVFKPAVSYYHKKGFGISAEGFLSSFKGKTGFYQFSLTPSYTYTKGKKLYLSVSYSRFFRKDGYEEAASPIQHDLFATGYLKKPWLQPGISLGFSNGRNTTYKYIDTVFLSIRRTFTDTAKTTINSVSVSAFVQHSFEYEDVFKRNDGISIKPKLLLNAGLNEYKEKHYNPYSAFFKKLKERRKSLGRLQDDAAFGLQSIACSLDINYISGKFGFEPQVYLDYYLPETSDKKFTYIYSFEISYSF